MKKSVYCWAVLFSVAARLVLSAATPLHTKISVEYRGLPLADALRDVEQKAGVRFEVDSSLVANQSPATFAMTDTEAGRVAMRLLRPVRLTMANTDGSSIRIVPRPQSEIFGVGREESFAFARKPAVTRKGDEVTISFETQGWCDVTVAIEDESGRILRHLASGVLGPNAPEPFQWNSKAQTLVWDGKDDAGVYVDDKDRIRVRVALGLNPRFERTLYWHPARRSGGYWAFATGKEGVLVFNSGRGIDQLRLFDREGNYVRAVYPFPADQVDSVRGLVRHRFPDGPELAIKPNWLQTALLKSGDNAYTPTYKDGRYDGHQSKRIAYAGMNGKAAQHLAVTGDAIAFFGHRLARFSTRGGGLGSLDVHGAAIAFEPGKSLWDATHANEGAQVRMIRPNRAAFSPDGQWLYLTRYNETMAGHGGVTLWRHRVKRMRFRGDDPPEPFLGNAAKGKEDGEFDMPADVACDAQGRVYVADHHNDRVQVFDAEGSHVRNISVRRPALLDVHPETGELYVFSWALPLDVGGRNNFLGTYPSMDRRGEGQTYFRLTRFSAFPETREQEQWNLQEVTGLTRTRPSNIELDAALDFHADSLRMWITAPSPVGARRNRHGLGPVLLALEDGAWTVKRDLLDEAGRAVVRAGPAAHQRERLTVNPADGMLYMYRGDTAHGKAFQRVLRIDPQTGRLRNVELPMSSEDMAFDRAGHAYLRSAEMVVRYQADGWREVPFDYGEERQRHNYGSGGGERSARVISGAVFPGNRGWHHGGMHVCPRGTIVVTTLYSTTLDSRTAGAQVHEGSSYQPLMYPGRRYNPGGRFGGALTHVIDRHGRLTHTDILPGLHANVHGTAIDGRGDLYVLNASPAVVHGERHFNDHAGTLIKFTPGQARILAPSGAPVPLQQPPRRPHDLYMPNAWVEGAQWLHPGVGWGSNYSTACACWNTRFSLDDFARSFIPEVDRCSVGVLDSAGNMMVRIGRYGNVEDGVPLLQGEDTPPNPRSIGGDETAFKHAPYLAVHTDNRLFAADPGNARVVSVRLGYHAEETVALKNVPDGGK